MKKPCPFCRGKELTKGTSTEDKEGVPTCIVCTNCGTYRPWKYIRQQTAPEQEGKGDG